MRLPLLDFLQNGCAGSDCGNVAVLKSNLFSAPADSNIDAFEVHGRAWNVVDKNVNPRKLHAMQRGTNLVDGHAGAVTFGGPDGLTAHERAKRHDSGDCSNTAGG